MHVVTQKRIWEAQEQYPEAATALDGWYRLIKANQFENFAQLKTLFSSVDKVNDQYVFDIGGNKLRLIAQILFDRKKVFIRAILTHKEYDKNQWKE
jgi:mRNA interferase HigB